MVYLFGLEQQPRRTNDQIEATVLVEAVTTWRTYPDLA